MAGGASATVSAGTLTASLGDVTDALAGDVSASASGTVGRGALVRLRSKKVGGGAATFALGGQSGAVSIGAVTPTPRVTPTSIAALLSQGAMGKSRVAALLGTATTSTQGGVGVPAAAVGTWQQLTVASHSRKVVTQVGSGSVTTFDPTKAAIVEAQSPTSVSSIPARGNSAPILGERGTVYIVGGLHSNYQGNEIDKMAMPTSGTVISTTISHQPNMPPEGKASGYASGSGGYIYRQADTTSGQVALSDDSNWQPYPGHQWTKQNWSPYWGFFSMTAHALQASYPSGAYTRLSGVLQSSHAQPTDDYPQMDEMQGAVGFDWTTGKYTTWLSETTQTYPQSMLGESGTSDWNNYDQAQLLIETNAGTTYINKWNPISGLTALASTSLIGGNDGHGSNGLLIRHLEANKYLILRQDAPSGTGLTGMKLFIYSEDFGTGNSRFVELTIPSTDTSGASVYADWLATSDHVTFCVDKASRRVYWLVHPQEGVACRFYVSTFEDLMTWTEVVITPSLTLPVAGGANDAFIGALRSPMIFQDGFLYLLWYQAGPDDAGYRDGAQSWKRARVVAGEELPTFTFAQFDHRDQPTLGQNFFTFSAEPGTLALWGTKHVNWAYRPSDGKYYQHAGDFGSSTCQSMATLEFDGTSRGFTFTEILDEVTLPPSGKVRPSSPDDGHWQYVPSTSTWTAGQDKFLWMRGGDGEPMFYNRFLRTAYGAGDQNGTYTQNAAAIADGWDLGSKFYLFDPATTTFTPVGPTKTLEADLSYSIASYDGWTQDNGSSFFSDVWLKSSGSSRCGVFDPTTGCLWRFYDALMLAKFDFINKTITCINCSYWVSPDTSRGYYVGGNAVGYTVEADGTKDAFGYYAADVPDPRNPGFGRWFTALSLKWEHKAIWLDQSDGKLYVVDPSTGYLWCFETRTALTDSGDGYNIVHYPVGNRIPLVGTFPATGSLDAYPPVPYGTVSGGTKGYTNGDTSMNSFLVPYKGGLLWWSMAHHYGGVTGHPAYSFWRRLGYEGDWTPVSFPQNLNANTYGVVDQSIDNAEVMLISTAGNVNDTPGPWPFFWKLT